MQLSGGEDQIWASQNCAGRPADGSSSPSKPDTIWRLGALLVEVGGRRQRCVSQVRGGRALATTRTRDTQTLRHKPEKTKTGPAEVLRRGCP